MLSERNSKIEQRKKEEKCKIKHQHAKESFIHQIKVYELAPKDLTLHLGFNYLVFTGEEREQCFLKLLVC